MRQVTIGNENGVRERPIAEMYNMTTHAVI
jgi:hypothetical protein